MFYKANFYHVTGGIFPGILVNSKMAGVSQFIEYAKIAG